MKSWVSQRWSALLLSLAAHLKRNDISFWINLDS